MKKKCRIITAVVMLTVYFLIHIIFTKDGTLTVPIIGRDRLARHFIVLHVRR